MPQQSVFEQPPTARRIYAKPPVLEAVVDLQIAQNEVVPLSAVATLNADNTSRYQVRHAIMTSAIEVDPHLGAVVQKKEELIGYRLTSADGTSVVQVRTNGFSFSRLRPYARWEEWRDEARLQWSTYRDTLKIETVQRIAVRYINRIDLPLMSGGRLRDFFRVYPDLPEGFPNTSIGFVMRLELRPPDLENGTLILNMGRVKSEKPNVASFLLDLDLFQVVALGADDDSVWSTVESLHNRENSLFESCITDSARSLFE